MSLVTGKFVLQVVHDAQLDASLDVTVELAGGVSAEPQLAAALAVSIRDALQRLNSEFANYVPSVRRRRRIVLLPHGDADYFPWV